MDYFNRYSKFPSEIMPLSNFQNVSDVMAGLINRIKSLRANGKYAEANKLINDNAALIKKSSIDAQWVYRMEEEIINAQILTLRNQQQVYISKIEPMAAEENDIWLQEYGESESNGDIGVMSSDEILKVINDYYNNKITLNDVKKIWKVGQSLYIDIDTIPASGQNKYGSWNLIGSNSMYNKYPEIQPSTTYEFVILDFEHDDLVTSINGHTKALLTLGMKDGFGHEANFDWLKTDYASYSKCLGTMCQLNSDFVTNLPTYSWNDCSRREWCNAAVIAALPDWIESNIKPVKKYTCYDSESLSLKTSNDYCFLLSETEVCGTNINTATTEGFLYEYYSNSNNRFKEFPTENMGVSNTRWFLRSIYPNLSIYYPDQNVNLFVNMTFDESSPLETTTTSTGTTYVSQIVVAAGISVAFCL